LAAVMSEGRFTRLSAVKTPDDLLRQLRRAVKLLNGSVNLISLAEDIFRWCQESDDLLNHHRRQLRGKRLPFINSFNIGANCGDQRQCGKTPLLCFNFPQSVGLHQQRTKPF
ncbi:type I-E CRISPR-associated protein Cse2/CasB, partial [Escherichia coli]|nr:type I-E CRISPR-associated protein Cse2/CasB [Escherichia coli]MDM9205842.1 type I-E CRISPR-associated protein Cse2/CasB [Escherichia coli]